MADETERLDKLFKNFQYLQSVYYRASNQDLDALWTQLGGTTIVFSEDYPHPGPLSFNKKKDLKVYCRAYPGDAICQKPEELLSTALTTANPAYRDQFSYQTLTGHSSTANKTNIPSALELDNLQSLIDKVLEPIQEALDADGQGKIQVNSAYRSDEVNEAVGGSDSSQHLHGLAADITVPNVDGFGTPAERFTQWVVEKNLAFDQMIWYDQDGGGHVHITTAQADRPWASDSKWMHARGGNGSIEYVPYATLDADGNVQFLEETLDEHEAEPPEADTAEEGETGTPPPTGEMDIRGPEPKVLTTAEQAAEEADQRIEVEVGGDKTVIGPSGKKPDSSTSQPGSVGIALDKIWDQSYDHIKKGINNLVQNNFISVDAFMSALKDIPGGELLMGPIVKEAGAAMLGLGTKDCPRPPMWSPPVSDFFKTLDLSRKDDPDGRETGNNCSRAKSKLHAEITLPRFDGFPIGPMNNIGGMIIQAAEDAAQQMLFNLLQSVFKNILTVSMNAGCETIGDIGQIIGGPSQFKDALRTAVCGPSANDEELAKGVNSILSALGDFGANVGSYPPPPSDEAVGDFIDAVGNTLTNQETKGLLDGDPSPEALKYVEEIIQSLPGGEVAALVTSQAQIKNMFSNLGAVLDSNIINTILDEGPVRPLNPSLCEPEAQNQWHNLRAAALSGKGFNPDQIMQQQKASDERQQQMLEDFGNIATTLDNLLPILLVSPDPECPEQGLLPNVGPETQKVTKNAIGDTFTLVNAVFLKDLIGGGRLGRKGLLDMILADTKGTGYKWHKEFFLKFFGASDSGELGIFDLFADADTGRNHDFLTIQNKVGHVLPETVAIHLKNTLESLAPPFKTTLKYFIAPGVVYGDNSLVVKEPDVVMEYSAWKDAFYDNPGSYSFTLNYDYFTLNQMGQPEWGNAFRFQRKNSFGRDGSLSFEGIRSIPTASQDYIDDIYSMPTPFESFLSSEYALPTTPGAGVVPPFGSSATSDKGVSGSAGTVAVDPSSDPDPSLPKLEHSPQATIFGKIVADIWKPYTSDVDSISHYCRDYLFDYINSAIIKKFLVKITKNSRAFDYGFDPTLAPIIHPLTDYETYGGDEDNPPYWIEEPEYGGWLGIYEAMAPKVDACERTPIIDFEQISDKVKEFDGKIVDDPRLKYNPDCAIEPPYSRILEKEAASAIEGTILALCRLYIVENFIKGMPVFSLFEAKTGVFDEVLFAYISETMLQDIYTLGGNVLFRPEIKKWTFYYIFLEQVVQNFERKRDLELLVPTAEETEALTELRKSLSTYREPTHPIFKKKKKRKKFDEYMAATKDYAKIILRRYISDELKEVSAAFKTALNPSIHDLSSLVFGSPDWMMGALTSAGPLHVPREIETSGILEDIYAPEKFSGFIDSNNLQTEITTDKFLKGSGYFPFALEKYIKINRYSQDDEPEDYNPPADLILNSPANRSNAVSPVVNLQDWEEFLAANTPPATSYKITDIWKSWSFGLRISFILPEEKQYHISPDFIDSIKANDALALKSLKLGAPITTIDDSDPRKIIFPLVSTEVEIKGDQVVNADLMQNYDEHITTCLINQLIKDPKYQTLFNYCFALPSLLSLATIYTIEGFIPSLGEEWGEYEKNGGKSGGGGLSAFRGWDRETFMRTKKMLRGMFRANYHVRDMDYEDPETDSKKEKVRKDARVRANLDWKIPWWKKRLQRPKPKDACEVVRRQEEGDPLKPKD